MGFAHFLWHTRTDIHPSPQSRSDCTINMRIMVIMSIYIEGDGLFGSWCSQSETGQEVYHLWDIKTLGAYIAVGINYVVSHSEMTVELI